MRYLVMVLSLAGCATMPAPEQDARSVHERLLVLDSHLDTPTHFERAGWDFAEGHSFDADNSQVDLPRMAAGGLDGGFFVIYTPQGELTPQGYAKALEDALGRAEAIRRTVATNGAAIEFATSAADAARIAAAGKVVAYQSIENSWPLGDDIANLQRFHALGVRMAGPVHSKNNQFADSTTDTPRWNGLSPLGRQWVAEMNRLGMVLDGSHSSDAALEQMIALSKTPVILSHSGPKAIFDHPRNISDDLMRKLAAAGGVMQVNSIFLEPFPKTPKTDGLLARKGGLRFQTEAEQAETLAAVAALRAGEEPFTTATFDMFMRSLIHAIEVMGIDHVGLGADWDGGGGVIGMMDVAALPQITERLLAAGYSEADIEKIMSGNMLRLLRAAEAHAAN